MTTQCDSCGRTVRPMDEESSWECSKVDCQHRKPLTADYIPIYRPWVKLIEEPKPED